MKTQVIGFDGGELKHEVTDDQPMVADTWLITLEYVCSPQGQVSPDYWRVSHGQASHNEPIGDEPNVALGRAISYLQSTAANAAECFNT